MDSCRLALKAAGSAASHATAVQANAIEVFMTFPRFRITRPVFRPSCR